MMKAMTLAALVCLLTASGATSAFAASFACGKAKGKIEKAICADPVVSDLDEYMGRYYAGAVEALNDGAACLKADQRAWVKRVRDACGADGKCLAKVYLARLSVLDGLQPGMNQLKNIDLPSGPVLISAIPASPEVTAGKGKPLAKSGKIVQEINDINNMGIAVKPKGGKAAAFIFEMDIGSSPTHELVNSLIDQPGVFEVRGMSTPQGGFDDGQCRYVYRLP